MSDQFRFIKISEQELEAKTGRFLNPVTTAIWKLHVEDGKLLVNVPNYSFEISPLTENHFRPINTSINLDIEFEQHQDSFLLMHLYAKGIKRATFEST